MLVRPRTVGLNTKLVLILLECIYVNRVLEIFLISVIQCFVPHLPSLALSESIPSLTPLLFWHLHRSYRLTLSGTLSEKKELLVVIQSGM